MNTVVQACHVFLAACDAETKKKGLWVAFSGGLDSTVLLHALHQACQVHALPLHALHAHHGLQKEADAWLTHCQKNCAALAIPLTLLHLNITPKAQHSLEQRARHARYAAMIQRIPQGACLLTAHHQDDQAETLLLQLLRGAGPQGLSAMPAYRKHPTHHHARPLLQLSQQQLRDYAQQQQLSWIDDPSNQDTRYRRNALRHDVIPLLHATWPAATACIARSAKHCAEQQSLLDGYAALLYEKLALPDDAWSPMGRLSITALKQHTPPQQRMLLRYWMKQHRLPFPGEKRLAACLTLLHCKEDAQPAVFWDVYALRRYRDALYLTPHYPNISQTILSWNPLETPQLMLPASFSLHALHPSATLQWPKDLTAKKNHVMLHFARLQGSIQRENGTHRQKSKQLYQAFAVPPWERNRIACIVIDGHVRWHAVFGLLQPNGTALTTAHQKKPATAP
jgi:tRNA(Ile)-lysidine synthase